MTAPAPLWKWVGGKRALLPELRRVVPAEFGRYFDPFVGGGAMFFDLAAQGRLEGGAVLADAAPAVVQAYRGIRDDPEEVIRQLRDLWPLKLAATMKRDEVVAGLFESLRAFLADAATHPSPRVAAALIAHQQLGFNGLWRVNQAGAPNVAAGKSANGAPLEVKVDADLIRACSVALDGVPVVEQATARAQLGLFASSRSTLFNKVEAGDLVYFDPPYLGDFDGYTPEGFGFDDHLRLRSIALDLAARGVHVIVSNSGCPEAVAMWSVEPFHVTRIERPGTVNSDTSKRAPVGEILVHTTRRTG